MWIIGLALLAVSCRQESTSGAPRFETVTINNVKPRRDVAGNILDAHGGCLQFFDGSYYLYGTAYGTNKTSLALNCPFRVYSSPDLQRWTFRGVLLKHPPRGVYTRPSVVFNPHTHKYVLWYNWFPTLWNGQAGVATSDSPVGPFTIVNPKAHLIGSCPGDGSLFEDDDGTGYYIYTDMNDGYAVRVEQLTPDYRDSTGKASNILAKGGEAPVLFRRKDRYYALTGPLCPDCPEGSEVQVFTASSPLGPFSTRLDWNINRRPASGTQIVSEQKASVTNQVNPGAAASGASTNSTRGLWVTASNQANAPIVPAQQTWVAKIPSAQGPLFVWMGDRWGSSPDGLKGHDLQFWSTPLRFTSDGNILPLHKVVEWKITWAWLK